MSECICTWLLLQSRTTDKQSFWFTIDYRKRAKEAILECKKKKKSSRQ